jgi:hypothetical protein
MRITSIARIDSLLTHLRPLPGRHNSHRNTAPWLKAAVVIVLFASSAAFSQNVQRDQSAVAAVQNAIAASGGTANLSQITDCTTQGTFPDPNDPTNQASFAWKTAGSDFNYTVQSSKMSRIFVSGLGTPADKQNGNLVLVGPHVLRSTLPYHIPGLVLLTELNNSNYSILYVGPEKRNGVSVIHIQTADKSDNIGSNVTPQDWYFDATSYLPVTVSYRVPDDANYLSCLSESLDFSALQQVDGVLIPFTEVSTTLAGAYTITITSVVFNSGLPPSTFQIQ